MTQNAMTLTGLGTPQVELTTEATEARDGLLREASKFRTVEDQIDADSAAAVLRDMQAFLRTIEAGRTSVKKPVLDVGRQIDDVARRLVARVKDESDRISRLLGSYQAEQRRLAEEQVRAERRRLEEEARKQAQAIAAAESEEEEQQAKEEAQRAIAERQAALAEVTTPKIDGTSVRQPWCFEVVDIQTLYKAAPHLCTIVPNNAAIRAVIKSNQDIPGLRIWQEAKAIISNR